MPLHCWTTRQVSKIRNQRLARHMRLGRSTRSYCKQVEKEALSAQGRIYGLRPKSYHIRRVCLFTAHWTISRPKVRLAVFFPTSHPSIETSVEPVLVASEQSAAGEIESRTQTQHQTSEASASKSDGFVYDQSVDWWSWGAMLFEMATGLPPFYEEEVSRTYQRIVCFKVSRVSA